MKMKEFGPPGGPRVPGAPWIRQWPCPLAAINKVRTCCLMDVEGFNEFSDTSNTYLEGGHLGMWAWAFTGV